MGQKTLFQINRLTFLAILILITSVMTYSFTLEIDPSISLGHYSPLIRGVGMATNGDFTKDRMYQCVKEANIRLVKMDAIENIGKNSNVNVYPSAAVWNFTEVDRLVKNIFACGAEPIFVLCGFPGDTNNYTISNKRDKNNLIVAADWSEYGRFAQGLVKHFNVDLACGKPIRYWDLWNEIDREPLGKMMQGMYDEFVQYVAPAMRAMDPNVKLCGPAASSWAHVEPYGNHHTEYTILHDGSHLNVITWHNQFIGSITDQLTMTKKNFREDPLFILNEQRYEYNGKKFQIGVTKYQMNPDVFNENKNSSAIWASSALLNAIKGKQSLSCQMTIQDDSEGVSLFGKDGTPQPAYYAYYLFGNHFGDEIVWSSSDSGDIETIVSKKNSSIYIMTINKNVSRATNLKVVFKNGLKVNTVYQWGIDTQKIDTTGFEYSLPNNTLSDFVPPLSVRIYKLEMPLVKLVLSTRKESLKPLPLLSAQTEIDCISIEYSRSMQGSIGFSLYSIEGKLVGKTIGKDGKAQIPCSRDGNFKRSYYIVMKQGKAVITSMKVLL